MTAEPPNPMRAALEEMVAAFDHIPLTGDYERRRAARAKAIDALSTKQEGEECGAGAAALDALEKAAQVADEFIGEMYPATTIGNRIRALKQEGLVAGGDGKGGKP